MTDIAIATKAKLAHSAQRDGLMQIDRHGWHGGVSYVLPGQPLNREQRRALNKQQKKEARRG